MTPESLAAIIRRHFSGDEMNNIDFTKNGSLLQYGKKEVNEQECPSGAHPKEEEWDQHGRLMADVL